MKIGWASNGSERSRKSDGVQASALTVKTLLGSSIYLFFSVHHNSRCSEMDRTERLERHPLFCSEPPSQSQRWWEIDPSSRWWGRIEQHDSCDGDQTNTMRVSKLAAATKWDVSMHPGGSFLRPHASTNNAYFSPWNRVEVCIIHLAQTFSSTCLAWACNHPHHRVRDLSLITGVHGRSSSSNFNQILASIGMEQVVHSNSVTYSGPLVKQFLSWRSGGRWRARCPL